MCIPQGPRAQSPNTTFESGHLIPNMSLVTLDRARAKNFVWSMYISGLGAPSMIKGINCCGSFVRSSYQETKRRTRVQRKGGDETNEIIQKEFRRYNIANRGSTPGLSPSTLAEREQPLYAIQVVHLARRLMFRYTVTILTEIASRFGIAWWLGPNTIRSFSPR